MKVLVTGGAGFIGSHIVDALVNNGADVTVVDNLATGFEYNLNCQARFYKLDIRDAGLSSVFAEVRPQVVIHEAAQTVVARSVIDPIYDAQVNLLGSLNVISCSIKSGVEKIVYASSCALYGKPRYIPVDEGHPVDPICQYGASKHTVEHYLYLNNSLYGLSYVALRYANVYGPRQNPAGEGGVVAIFSGRMLAGRQPIIFGVGDKTRDYVYVEDAVRANLLAVEAPVSGIYNIGTGIETTDQTVFDVMSQEFGYSAAPGYADERRGEIKRISLDYSKALKELGWQPEISFDEGIARAAAYYRSALLKV